MIPNKLHKIPGIYCIRCIVTNKVYIGKAHNIFKRIREHVYRLNTTYDKDENRLLHNSWKKYGIESFEYFVVEQFDNVNEVILAERELFWIKSYNSTNRDCGYNLRLDSDSRCIVHKETSRKISERLKKEWSSGIRNTHSNKLKESWNNRDRTLQSKLFSKTLTKYVYIVNGIPLSYKDLKDKHIQNCIATFYKCKCNKVTFKNYVIERVLTKDIVQSS